MRSGIPLPRQLQDQGGVVSYLSRVHGGAAAKNKSGVFLALQNTSCRTIALRASNKIFLACFPLPLVLFLVKVMGHSSSLPHLHYRICPNIGGCPPPPSPIIDASVQNWCILEIHSTVVGEKVLCTCCCKALPVSCITKIIFHHKILSCNNAIVQSLAKLNTCINRLISIYSSCSLSVAAVKNEGVYVETLCWHERNSVIVCCII